jgi:hypothetical protein
VGHGFFIDAVEASTFHDVLIGPSSEKLEILETPSMMVQPSDFLFEFSFLFVRENIKYIFKQPIICNED